MIGYIIQINNYIKNFIIKNGLLYFGQYLIKLNRSIYIQRIIQIAFSMTTAIMGI